MVKKVIDKTVFKSSYQSSSINKFLVKCPWKNTSTPLYTNMLMSSVFVKKQDVSYSLREMNSMRNRHKKIQ